MGHKLQAAFGLLWTVVVCLLLLIVLCFTILIDHSFQLETFEIRLKTQQRFDRPDVKPPTPELEMDI